VSTFVETSHRIKVRSADDQNVTQEAVRVARTPFITWALSVAGRRERPLPNAAPVEETRVAK
jgi:hypothetical protein